MLNQSFFHECAIAGNSGRTFRPRQDVLLVNGDTISIVQMGPDFLLLERPFDHPPVTASVVLHVEESERRWNVHLPNGISASSKRVAIAASA